MLEPRSSSLSEGKMRALGAVVVAQSPLSRCRFLQFSPIITGVNVGRGCAAIAWQAPGGRRLVVLLDWLSRSRASMGREEDSEARAAIQSRNAGRGGAPPQADDQ